LYGLKLEAGNTTHVGRKCKISTDTVVEIIVICKHAISLAVTVIYCTKQYAPCAVYITSLWKINPLLLNSRTLHSGKQTE